MISEKRVAHIVALSRSMRSDDRLQLTDPLSELKCFVLDGRPIAIGFGNRPGLILVEDIECSLVVVEIQLSVHNLACLRIDIHLLTERGTDDAEPAELGEVLLRVDRKSTRLNSS